MEEAAGKLIRQRKLGREPGDIDLETFKKRKDALREEIEQLRQETKAGVTEERRRQILKRSDEIERELELLEARRFQDEEGHWVLAFFL